MRIPALALLAALTATACSGSSSAGPSAQPPSSVSSSLAIVTAGASYKLYLPPAASPTSAHARLAVLDPAAPAGASGLLHFIDLGADGEVWAVGADGQDVVAVDRDHPTVWFIDAATDTVRGTVTLPAAAQPIFGSQQGSTYATGVLVDAAHRRAYVDTSFAVLQYDLDSRAVTATFPAYPSEHFTIDRTAGRIYAPFYMCDPTFPEGGNVCTAFLQPGGPPLTDSLRVIDVGSGKSWALEDPASPTTWSPLGAEPDAAALDRGLGVLAVAIEAPTSIVVVDLAAVVTDDATQTCQVDPARRPAFDMPAGQFTALVADQVTHLLVAAQEDGSDVAVLDLAKAKAGQTSGLTATIPDPPTGGPWYNHGDAHGVSAGVLGGRPYAFLVNSDRSWVARIDLTGVQGVLAGTGTFGSQLSFISVPTPP